VDDPELHSLSASEKHPRGIDERKTGGFGRRTRAGWKMNHALGGVGDGHQSKGGGITRKGKINGFESGVEDKRLFR